MKVGGGYVGKHSRGLGLEKCKVNIIIFLWIHV